MDQKNNVLGFFAVAIVLLLVLIAMVVLPSYFKKAEIENDKYNNFPFFKGEDSYWYTVVEKNGQPYQIPFYYHPRELEQIVVEPGVRERFFAIRDARGQIYISVDPNAESNKVVIAGVEIAKITGDRYGLLNVSTRSAFTRNPFNATTNSNTPVVTCADANNVTLVLGFVQSNKNVAYARGNCLILEAQDPDSYIKVADRLAYHLLGIMI